MRHMKKFASLLLAMIMVMALALPALADEGGENVDAPQEDAPVKEPLEVAVSADENYNYQIYQIFKAAPGSGGLEAGTIAWGDSVKNPAAFVQLLKDNYKGTAENPGIFDAADAGDPAKVAQIISDNFKAASDAVALAELIGKNASTLFDMVTLVPAPADEMNQPTLYTGWWLMEERVEGGTGDPLYRVHQVTTDTLDLEPKKGKPSVEKEVANPDAADGWSNAAIYPTGEDNEFQFKLTATLPTNFKTEYRDKNKSYIITFHDRHNAGLTVVQDLSKLTVAICDADGNVLKTLAAGTDYTVNWNGDEHTTQAEGKPAHENCDFTVTVNNLVAHTQAAPEGKVVVTYTAYLNENADFTTAGNWNNVWLEAPDSEENEDKVPVYSLKINISKVDGETPARPLAGATFQLSKKNPETGEYENIGEVQSGTALTEGGVANQYNWQGLTPGDYRLTEVDVPTTDPDGNPMSYGKIDPIDFTITADLASDGTLTVTPTGDITFSVDQGVTKADIVNRSGIVLPSTGGIGTTIFYVLGGLLVAGAVILLVTKRRMSASEE